MAGILGMEGLSTGQVQEELRRGGRFVVFEYCVSCLVMSMRRSSDVYFVRAGQGTFGMSLGYTLLSLFLGHVLSLSSRLETDRHSNLPNGRLHQNLLSIPPRQNLLGQLYTIFPVRQPRQRLLPCMAEP